jgi:NNP family nitrate/nitrite transporter-like MFS transporter
LNSNLETYNPEDATFWDQAGRHIANRNLLVSSVCLGLAFVVWFYWSILVLYLNDVGFDLTTSQILTLMGVPMITGATLRVVYSFVVPIFGGRNWTVVSTASLLVPTIGIGMVIQDPTTSYTTLLILAGFCGLGGGNFASSMANIGPFYPKRLQGLVLGANAGFGNLGVSILQFVAPLTLGFALYEPLTGSAQPWSGGPSGAVFLQNVAYIWVVPIVVATVAAYFFMNNLRAIHFPLREQAQAFRNKHMYIITTLYVMSFGSFVGFSALFPLLSQM